MKTVNRICQILAIIFGLAALVCFFLPFATLVSNQEGIRAVGAQLAFGSELKNAAGTAFDMARSADILLCFWLTVIGLAFSAFSFKSKKLRYASSAFGLGAAIYMLVITLSNPWKFVDTRPLPDVSKVEYEPFVLICTIVLFLFAAACIAYLLIDDYLEVLESKKITIPKRVIRFFRDYKSEVKKIVWPGFRDVLKNTVIVLIMCALIGVLIWVVDWALGDLLLKNLLGVK